MNVVFKVFWDNPIEMQTEVGEQPLEFNIPLGAIIADPSMSSDLSNYYTKPQTDTQISTSVTLKADKTYVDTQDNLLQDQLNLKANASEVNQSLGTKADLVDGKIPASQLPSFVDDVLEGTYINPTTFNNLNSQPYTPETGKIYIDTTTNKTYRWSGMLYVVISSGGVALGETSETAYRGDRGKVAYDHSQSQGNPHNSTTSDITEGSRLYFTDARVRATSLTGLSVATGGTITSADTVLGALGKIQNQVTNSGGGSSSPTWVNITTVGTIPAYVTNADIQVARFQGMLWIKGTFNVNTNVLINNELFRITAQAYKPYAYSTAGTGRLLMLLNCVNMISASNKLIGFSALGNITNSTQALTVDVIFEAKTTLATTDGTLNIVPTIISNLAY